MTKVQIGNAAAIPSIATKQKRKTIKIKKQIILIMLFLVFVKIDTTFLSQLTQSLVIIYHGTINLNNHQITGTNI